MEGSAILENLREILLVGVKTSICKCMYWEAGVLFRLLGLGLQTDLLIGIY